MPASYTNRAGIVVTVQSSDLTKLNRSLRKLGNGKELRRALNKQLKAEALPAAEAVRAAVLATPAKAAPQTGLRAKIAKAVRVKVATSSVSIFVNTKLKSAAGVGALAKYMEGAPGYTRWRHPTYGRDPWVTQPAHPYFYRTLATRKGRFVKAAEKTMREMARQAGFR